MTSRKSSRVRFAVVGLGHFAQAAILPAFANAKDKAELAALVTGDADKAKQLSKEYGVPAHSYDQLDALLAAGEIDVVYIAVPNSLHRKYTECAARAGVHVLCEKPLAYTTADAEAMIATCEQAGVLLMTAYRLHFEEGNLQAIKAVTSQKIGEARLFDSLHTMQVAAGNTRIDRDLGGGPLEDIGIYCLNAARYLLGDEPEEVVAFAIKGTDERFVEVPEAVSAILRFPRNRLATFMCGFGETKTSEYRVVGTEGMLIMNPAFTWQNDIEQKLVLKEQEVTTKFPHRDQIAAEILYFSDCVHEGREPEPSGREGLIDVRIIEALRKSYDTQQPVRLSPKEADKKPDPSQSIHRQPPAEPKTVKVAAPSQS